MGHVSLRLCAIVLAAGCGDNGVAPDAAPAPALDAATDATIDALLDATIDGAAIHTCAEGPRISVRALHRHAFDELRPYPALRVVLMAPDGSTSTATTDADGRASFAGIDGSTLFVHGIIDTDETTHVFTQLPACAAVELRPPPWFHRGGPNLGQASFQFAAAPSQRYYVYGPCGVSGSGSGSVVTARIEQVESCDEYEDDATLLALHDNGVRIDGWATLTGVDLSAIVGQVVVVPPLQPPVTATVHWTGLPAGWFVADDVFFDGPGFTQMQGRGDFEVTGPSYDDALSVTPIGPATLISRLSERVPAPVSELRVVERVRPIADLDQSVDGAGAMGTLTNVGVGPGISVHWTWGGNATHRGDLVIARLSRLGVRIYGPGDVDHLEVPAWPAELADVRPDATQLDRPYLVAYDLDGDATYATALAGARLATNFIGAGQGPGFADVAGWRSTNQFLHP